MARTKDTNAIFVKIGKYEYKIIAPAVLIPASETHNHAGEWEAIVTIYKSSNDMPTKAQSFPDHPQYGSTREEAIKKGQDYGQKLVQRTAEGLKDYMT